MGEEALRNTDPGGVAGSVTGDCGFCSAFRPKINLLLAPFSRKLPKINLAESRRAGPGVAGPAERPPWREARTVFPAAGQGVWSRLETDSDRLIPGFVPVPARSQERENSRGPVESQRGAATSLSERLRRQPVGEIMAPERGAGAPGDAPVDRPKVAAASELLLRDDDGQEWQLLASFGKLEPHQVAGVRWLWDALLGRHRPGCCGGILGDEPGLGKTAQALAVLWAAVTSGVASRVLIVAPASLCAVWRREAALWLGAQTNVACVDEKAADAQRHAPALLLRLLSTEAPEHLMVVVGYEQLRVTRDSIFRVQWCSCDRTNANGVGSGNEGAPSSSNAFTQSRTVLHTAARKHIYNG